MAIAANTFGSVSPPDVRHLVTPVLSTLPGAAVSTQPAPAVLPFLSPILRQRVQLLSSASHEPWLRLLSYDTSKVPKLMEIAQRGDLEPHPASGEIEVDWDYGVDVAFRRLDAETLQALVVLRDLDLYFRLVYCIGDKEGGGDGWRVGEVGVASNPSALSDFAGQPSISEAQKRFETEQQQRQQSGAAQVPVTATTRLYDPEPSDDDDDDDDYWARYDATPARTPALKRSPAPQSMQGATAASTTSSRQPTRPDEPSTADDDAYFAQYDNVQPAMDNHDPDEENDYTQTAPPLGLAARALAPEVGADGNAHSASQNGTTSGGWTLAEPPHDDNNTNHNNNGAGAGELVHPRPSSSAGRSSSSSVSVARLEEAAEKREQGEFGVRQHVSRSIRSLFLLARASGIDREEFERMVRTELDVLGMVEDEL
ncbi:hypothetical protein VTK73DRAFT_7604 [Phialemonium thermophilum]|uniref:Uncharacterized protein n=1 Tax=Phialemonium thermophilum TaxID=223376 RepID=A0ABR3WD39_9PEZI